MFDKDRSLGENAADLVRGGAKWGIAGLGVAGFAYLIYSFFKGMMDEDSMFAPIGKFFGFVSALGFAVLAAPSILAWAKNSAVPGIENWMGKAGDFIKGLWSKFTGPSASGPRADLAPELTGEPRRTNLSMVMPERPDVALGAVVYEGDVPQGEAVRPAVAVASTTRPVSETAVISA